MRMEQTRAVRFVLLAACLTIPPSVAWPQAATRNVVLIVPDGLRWQEVFAGADAGLMNREQGGVRDAERLRRDFGRATPAEARRALLPFLWDVAVPRGQIFGNQREGSVARVLNGLNFSYPGYNELLTGLPDPRVNSNSLGPNPNVTVFEFLNRQPELRGRVAAFGTWGVFRDIFNQGRSGLPVFAGWDPPSFAQAVPRLAPLVEVQHAMTRLWEDNLHDSFLHAWLKEFVREHRPRLLFVGYGETDEWAHMGRYDLTLRAAHQFDRYVAELWQMLQDMAEYRDRTTFILAADHGRGDRPESWQRHGRDVPGSEAVWIAVFGPDTEALGERRHAPPVTLGQVAATVAALLGYDWQREAPEAAPPLADVLPRRSQAPQPARR